VCAWKIRFREKWNMVKIDAPNEQPKNQISRCRPSSYNQRKPNPRWLLKMAIAAMLDERRRWSSKGIFFQLPPMSHQKIRPVDPISQRKNGGLLGAASKYGFIELPSSTVYIIDVHFWFRNMIK
jgi:hypothetical protein